MSLCRKNTALLPKEKSCIIVFGIPNYIVHYARETFLRDALKQCSFLIDITFGFTPPINISVIENHKITQNKGKVFKERSLQFMSDNSYFLHKHFSPPDSFPSGFSCSAVELKSFQFMVQTDTELSVSSCQSASDQVKIERSAQNILFEKFIFHQRTSLWNSGTYKMGISVEKNLSVKLDINNIKMIPFLPFHSLSLGTEIPLQCLAFFGKDIQIYPQITQITSPRWKLNEMFPFRRQTGIFAMRQRKLFSQYGKLIFEK